MGRGIRKTIFHSMDINNEISNSLSARNFPIWYPTIFVSLSPLTYASSTKFNDISSAWREGAGGKWNKGKKRAQEEEEVLGHRGHGWLVCTPILRMAILDRGCPGWNLDQDERTLRGHYLDGKHTWTVWFVLPSRPHITARPLCIGMRFLFKWESIRISRRTRGQNDASKTFLLPDTNQRFLCAAPHPTS